MAAAALRPPTERADALVVGAGPAGIAAVLALVGPAPALRTVVWVDPAFESGRLSRLTAVPSNTKVDKLVSAGNFLHPVFEVVGKPVALAVERLVAGAHALPGSRDPSALGWTHLGACKAVFDAATAGLLDCGAVRAVRGHVTSLDHCAASSTWSARVLAGPEAKAGGSEVEVVVDARCVVLATGSAPKELALAAGARCQALSCETAFDPGELRAALRRGSRVAVLGNSHSAAIVLANLHALAEALDLHVGNFARRPVRFAEWLPELDTYRYNATGLKGFGAVFGEAEMVPQGRAAAEGWLQICPFDTFAADDWDYAIDCTGYVPSALPALPHEVAGGGWPARDEPTGQLGAVPGLYALGAPWGEPPGRVWGRGLEQTEGFRGEDSLTGFSVFLSRASLIGAHARVLLGLVAPAATSEDEEPEEKVPSMPPVQARYRDREGICVK